MPTDLSPAQLKHRKVLVIGESIHDEYLFGQVSRLSREAPVPIVANPHSSYRCGGAANAAANVSSLGGNATLVSALGADAPGRRLREICISHDIRCEFLSLPATNTKQRILGSGQQLLRVDRMVDKCGLAHELAQVAEKNLGGHDAMLLSDYGSDFLDAAPAIIAAAKQAGMPVVVDPRGDNWSRFAGADLFKPSLEEFMPGARLDDPAVTESCMLLMAEHKFGAILLTGGRQGMLLLRYGHPPDHLPTRAQDVYDVTGAGDTVAAVMALGLAAGMGAHDAARMANRAAGTVVTKLGTVPVRPEDLTAPPLGHGGLIVALEELLDILDPQRVAGKRVVMTNGCFDILHAGHLDTLSAAATLGDLLVVAVNDDESVASLKGSGRPIIPLLERQQLLAGLGCVDYVLSFAGVHATAEVTAIAPDVYVKGGDWADKEPPEAHAAKDKGGTVTFLDMRQEQSTTAIVKAVRKDD